MTDHGPTGTRPTRCAWALTDPLLQSYHDLEWGVPQYDSAALWQKLMLDGFQAGLSWRLILQRRDALRAAFAGFDPAIVAGYAESEVARLLQAPGMIRSEIKIRAVLHNARAYQAMQAAGEDLAEWAWAMTGPRPRLGDGSGSSTRSILGDQLSAQLRRRGFKFVGPLICHAWAQACGLINDHAHDCFRR